MRLTRQLPRLEGVVELLDRPGNAEEEIQGNLRDLARLNRYFGGVRTVRRHLRRLLGSRPHGPLTILDIGTGGADIPRALCRWARRRRLRVAVEAVDRNPEVVAAASAWCADYPEIQVRQAEAPPLPYPDGSFDYAIASLFLHHLTDEAGVYLLQEMARVARRGLIVSDLRRSRTAWALTGSAIRLLTTNRLTRHDAPLSVLRGFRPEELSRMAAQAGLFEAEISCHRCFRIALIHEIPPGATPATASGPVRP